MNVSRIALNISFVSASLVISSSSCSNKNTRDNESKNRPNILFIFTDQQNVKAVSANGNPYLQTPNQDLLVKNGISFLNSYCTSPVCGPSRSSLITGRMPHETGVNYNDGSSIKDSIQTFGEILRNTGYETVWAGKWHLPASYPITGKNPKTTSRGFEFLKFYNTDSTDWSHGSKTDTPLADAAVNFIQNYEGPRPFFLAVSFHNPHDICYFPRNPDNYPNPDNSIALPPLPVNHNFRNDEPELISNSRFRDHYGDELLLSQKNDENRWRAYLWYYYRLTEKVDREIGRLLQAIKEKGIEENTLIIFTSDHGDGMAEKKWAAKLSIYDGPAKVPFILYYKGKISATGIDNDHLISGIDIFPTILDYAGIDIPENLNGVSIKKVIEHPEKQVRKFLVTELGVDPKDHSLTGRMIRTQQFKYNIYSKGDRNEELFDMIEDPYEMNNLAYDENMQEVKNQLKSDLKGWILKTNDPFTAANF